MNIKYLLLTLVLPVSAFAQGSLQLSFLEQGASQKADDLKTCLIGQFSKINLVANQTQKSTENETLKSFRAEKHLVSLPYTSSGEEDYSKLRVSSSIELGIMKYDFYLRITALKKLSGEQNDLKSLVTLDACENPFYSLIQAVRDVESTENSMENAAH